MFGLDVIPFPLAYTTTYKVERNPIKKRRRNWRVVRVVQPGCWQAGNTLYAHPEVVTKMLAMLRQPTNGKPQG